MKIIKTPKVELGTPIDTNDYPPFVEDFVDTLDDSKLGLFYRNIRNAQIINMDMNDFNLDAAAEYEMFKNALHYDKKNYKDYVMHELFHLGSTIATDDRVFSGFLQYSANDMLGIGIGLTDGYTNYLDKKYFGNYTPNKEKVTSRVYIMSTLVSEWLNVLIGPDYMEELYRKANLHKLVQLLSFYSNKKKAIRFILDIDELYYRIDRYYKQTFKNIYRAKKVYNRIILFLSECYMTKFQMMKDENLLTDYEYEKSDEYVRHFMNYKLHINNKVKTKSMLTYYDAMKEKVNNKLKTK